MDEPRPRPIALAGAVLAGLLYVGALGGGRAYLFAPLVFVPLFLAVRGAAPARAALLGGVTGLVACGVGFRWVFPAIRRFGDLGLAETTLVFALFVVVEAGRFAVQAWAMGRLAPRLGSVAAAGLSFVLAETAVPAPIRFSFALAASGRLELLQLAELGGPVAVALPFVLSAACLARCLGSRAPRWLAAALLPVALSFVYGALRLPSVDAASRASPPLRVGLVQAPMPLDRQPVGEARALAEELRLQRDLEQAGAELIVWPESSLPMTVEAARAQAMVDELLPRLSVPTIVGAEVVERGPGGVRSYNSALVIGPGGLVDRYDKRFLLLFSERVPFGELMPSWRRHFPSAARIHPGERSGPRVVLGRPIAITLCYEDALAGATLEAAGHGEADLLVNLTNDAWFDGSAEPALHLGLARMRAIESRRHLLHATTTGASAVVDPAGRILASAPPATVASLLVDVRWGHGTTPFAAAGELFWALTCVVALLLALRGRGRARQPHCDPPITPPAR